MTALDRVAACGARVARRGRGVGVVVRGGRAHFTGVQTCGSVWACPVCSAAIRQARAEQVEAVTRGFLGADPRHRALFVTLTLPHDARDGLAALLDTLAKGWDHVTNRKAWRRLVAGAVRAVEVTHGRNGWHPHLHVLVYVAADAPANVAELVHELVTTHWGNYAERRGWRRPSEAHGVLTRAVSLLEGDGLSRYLSKVQDGYGDERYLGAEMTRGDLKRGRKSSRVPFEIAESAAAGNAADLRLWQEYEQATRRRRCLTWSQGLAAEYGQDVAGDDESLAAPPEDGETLTVLTEDEWAAVVRYGYEAKFLDAAEDDGLAGVLDVLLTLRRRAEWEERRRRRRARD